MTKNEAIVYYVMSLSELTVTHTDDILDLLTGICWDEEKANELKNIIGASQ